jgi:flagellar protein FliO/FliZ
MLDALLGGGLPFVAGLLFTLLVLGGSIWTIRRLGIGRSRSGNERGKQSRLVVIEAAAVGERRRLVLIRRDNVEHLLMIGGPTDVVIEPNIVRAAVATRESPAPSRAPATTDTLPRAVPLGDAGTAPRRQPRPVDPLAGVSAEVTHLPEPTPRMPANLGGPSGFVPREPARQREREAQIEREPARERQALRKREPMREREPIMREPMREREREPARMRELQPSPAVAEPEFNASADQHLADLAQQLEAALRRPTKAGEALSEANVPKSTQDAKLTGTRRMSGYRSVQS